MSKYTLDSQLNEILTVPAVLSFFNSKIPGMIDSPSYQYMSGVPLKVLIANAPEYEDVLRACLQIANGEKITVVIRDRSVLKPEIITSDSFTVDVDDVDGQYYMLEKGFAGSLVVRFTKEMNENVKGQVTYRGKPVNNTLLKRIVDAGDIQMFGIPVRNICTEYGQKYEFVVRGFQDVDGNMMDPQTIVVNTLPEPEIDSKYADHDNVALQAAQEGIVLFKNNNVLPLDSTTAIKLYNGHDFRLAAVGAGKINPRYSINVIRAIQKYSEFKLDTSATTGVMIISRASGENFDNQAIDGEYYLTKSEEKQLEDLKETCTSSIVIINSGYPIDVSWIKRYDIDAVLWCGYPGMVGGKALVEILDGRVDPSAKLPDTWANDYYDYPTSTNFYQPAKGEEKLKADSPYFVDTVYEEGIYVGYRYFDTFHKSVAYPFGYGLSYTSFKLTTTLEGCEIRTVVKNTGSVSGKDVVEVFAIVPDGKIEQPSKRLIAFAKTKLLASGESQIITIDIDKHQLTSFDVSTASWILEKGNYQIIVSDDGIHFDNIGSYNQQDNEKVRQSHHYMVSPIAIDSLSKFKNNFPMGLNSGVKTKYTSLTPQAKRHHFVATENKFTRLTGSYTVEELARLSVCASAGWGMHETGEAGRVYRLENHNTPHYAVADGNNGVNVHKPNIGMPCSNTVCASWNNELAYKVGQVIAEEAKELNIQMILGPAMNIHRDPLNGRHPEYFSEDPYLAGIMAGNQSKGLEDHGVSSCFKHVVANNSESSRKRNHSFIDERALREIYLKVFEVAMSVHQPDSIMTGYNACNGSFVAEDEELLQGIFENEFGFNGFVMTDWNSYDTVNVASAVSAGNCWITPGSTDNTYTQPIIDGVKNNQIELLRLQDNVGRLLSIITKRS